MAQTLLVIIAVAWIFNVILINSEQINMVTSWNYGNPNGKHMYFH